MVEETDMKDLEKWLKSRGTHSEGVALYMKYGKNKNLHRYFTNTSSHTSGAKLRRELEKLLATPVKATPTPKKKAKPAPQKQDPAPKTFGDIPVLPDIEDIDKYAVSKLPHIDFAKLPEELRAKYVRLIEIDRNVRQAHWRLSFHDQAEQRRELAKFIIEGKEEVTRLWEELDYWYDTGQVIPNSTSSLDFTQMSDIDLLKHENNRKSSVSKFNTRTEELEQLLKDEKVSDKEKERLKVKLHKAHTTLDKHRADYKAIQEEIIRRRSTSEQS